MKSLIILLAIFLSASLAFAQNPVWSKKYHTGSVTCLDFSGDGGKLASGSLDSTIRFWKVNSGEVIKKVHLGKHLPSSFTFNSTNDKLLGIMVWFSQDPYFHFRIPISFFLNSDEDTVSEGFPFVISREYGSTGSFHLHYLDNTFSEIINDTIAIHMISGGAFGYRNQYELEGSAGDVSTFNLNTLVSVNVDLNICNTSYSPNYNVFTLSQSKSKFFASGNCNFQETRNSQITSEYYSKISTIVDFSKKQKFECERISKENVLKAIFSADDSLLLISRKNGEILEFSSEGKFLKDFSTATSLTTALATDFKNRYYISAHADSTLRLWTPDIPNIFKRILLKSPVTTIAVSPDSVHFATAHTDGTVALWDIMALANSAPSDTVFTSIAEENPFKNATLTAEPNPFKNSTMIRFSLEKPLKIKLAVTDILGREIAVLKDELVEIGEQNVVFKNENLPNGTYFITLSGDGLLKTIPVNIAR